MFAAANPDKDSGVSMRDLQHCLRSNCPNCDCLDGMQQRVTRIFEASHAIHSLSTGSSVAQRSQDSTTARRLAESPPAELTQEDVEALCTITPLHKQARTLSTNDFNSLQAVCHLLRATEAPAQRDRSSNPRRLIGNTCDQTLEDILKIDNMLRGSWEIIQGYKLDAQCVRTDNPGAGQGPQGVLNAATLINLQLHKQGPRTLRNLENSLARRIRSGIHLVIDDFGLTIASIDAALTDGTAVVVRVRPEGTEYQSETEPYYLWMEAADFVGRTEENPHGDINDQVTKLNDLLLLGVLSRSQSTGHAQFAWFHRACNPNWGPGHSGMQILRRALFEFLRTGVQNNALNHLGKDYDMRYGDLEFNMPFVLGGNGRLTLDPWELRATFSEHYRRYYIIDGFWDAVNWKGGDGGPNAELPAALGNLHDRHRRWP